jgi:hypothetical protein
MDESYNTMVLVLYFELMEIHFSPLLKWVSPVPVAPPCYTLFAPLALVNPYFFVTPTHMSRQENLIKFCKTHMKLNENQYSCIIGIVVARLSMR